MEASLVILWTAPLVPVCRWRACGWRGPARHVPDARLRPRRLPPGDCRGFRRRPDPWRNRIVLHPNPWGRRQAPRAAYRLAVFLLLPGVYATFFRRVHRWLQERWPVG